MRKEELIKKFVELCGDLAISNDSVSEETVLNFINSIQSKENNGWIKIESENIILPIDGTEVHFYYSFINENGIQNEYHKGIFNAALGFTSYYDSENYKVKEVTHYQPIHKPKPPIY